MMYLFEKNKRPISMLLALAMFVAMFMWSGSSMVAAESNTTSKDEVVYANLDPTGSLEEMFVVNVLDINNSGTGTDYGQYSEVVNLTDTSNIQNTNGKIEVTSSPGKFYYEGYGADSELPWLVSINYTLDGKVINPNELAGNSGKLKISITTKKNTLADEIFYDNYMLQISVPLDMDKAENIDSGGGTEGLSGGTKLINYTVLPGNDADYSLTANINDFEMGSIQISAIPFSMDFDLGDLTSQFDELVNAVAQLEDGMSSLDSGIQAADKGLIKLRKGSSKLNKGLKDLNSGTDLLSKSSNSVSSGLNSMSSILNSAVDVNEIDLLVNTMNGMASGLSQMSSGLSGMLQGIQGARVSVPSYPAVYVDGLGQSATDQALKTYILGAKGFIDTYDTYSTSMSGIVTSIGAISTGLTTIAGELDGLKAIGQLQGGLAKLAGEYTTLNSYMQKYFFGVNSIASQYGQMNSGISQASKGMTKMGDGSSELAKGMKQFNASVNDIPNQIQEQIDGLMGGGDFEPVSFVSDKNDNINSVQFVITTSKIEKEKIVKVDEEDTGKESILDKIIGLFK